MKIVSRLTASLALALSVALGATACAPASEPITLTAESVVIDVRTPEEYADGHLEGAVNIDVSAPDFDTAIDTLNRDGDYIVYCRSGNRSAQAVSRMTALGFTSITDAGGVDAASATTGLPLVQLSR